MFHTLHKFGEVDVELSQAALTVLGRHTWYLQEQTVPMALFSDKLTVDEKSRLAARILTFEDQKETLERAKLEKPNLKITVSSTTTLCDLVGPKSFLFWDIMMLGYEWLRLDPGLWEESDDYNELRDYVRTVKVTNDVAERGIKVLHYKLYLYIILIFISADHRLF